MHIQKFNIHGPALLTPKVYSDDRGYLTETFNLDRMRALLGPSLYFIQDNQTLSSTAGTVRGLHYQAPPYAQGKLISCIFGEVLDVIVDVRVGSETYGKHISVSLSADNHQQFWVPPGFLHGFKTIVDNTIISYKVSGPYMPDFEGAILYNDPDLAINWGLTSDPILSERDAAAIPFADWISPFKASTKKQS